MHIALSCGRFNLSLNRPQIMGILNVTPDSFSDGGLHTNTQQAIDYGLKLVSEGADILDVGGESTRPGAQPVTLAEELARVIPVIRALASQIEIPISIDTNKPEIMQAAVEAGACMINDVYALRQPGALDMAAQLQVPVCLMHMQGTPQDMQTAPQYEDVIKSVQQFFAERLFACELAGIDRRRIILDPGFGFGKTLAHNIELLKNLQHFSSFERPLLVGLSNKTMIGAITGRAAQERTYGSVAAALQAISKGASIVRVHDVRATHDALTVWNATQ